MGLGTECRRVRPTTTVEGKQGLAYEIGISAGTAGARGLHVQRVFIAPGAKAKAHKHAEHETVIYALEGRSGCWYGDALEHHVEIQPGDFFYIPANVAHLPYNTGIDGPFIALVARTDPDEQESVTLLPQLDKLPHIEALACSATQATSPIVTFA